MRRCTKKEHNANGHSPVADFTAPPDIIRRVAESQGKYFAPFNHVDPFLMARDALNPEKPFANAANFVRFAPLDNKKVIEIGSGYSVNHIVWAKHFHIDGYCLEPDGEGFDSSHKIARELMEINGLDPNRVIDAAGENIPFEDDAFDVVYSTNALEHVRRPADVLSESLRVLKPGGLMQFVYPNYHSLYDGHYKTFHPPVLFRRFFPWWVEHVLRRDPAFAWTLRTELNVRWTNDALETLGRRRRFHVLSRGEEVFHDRMATLNFGAWGGLTKVKDALRAATKLKVNRVLGRLFIQLGMWTPIILTIRKGAARGLANNF